MRMFAGFLAILAMAGVMGVGLVYADEITASTDKETYHYGEEIIITGKCAGGQSVALFMQDLSNAGSRHLDQLTVSGGQFMTKITTEGARFVHPAQYEIKLGCLLGSDESASTLLVFELLSPRDAPESVPEPEMPVPVPEPVPKLESIPELESIAEPEPTRQIPAKFVDREKDPQTYVDRYNNEPEYKKWFDENHSEYATIYEAVGLDEPAMDGGDAPEPVPEPVPGSVPEPVPEAEQTRQIPAEFVDKGVNPQTYVDRYNGEASYRQWFDDNYPQYATIYEAVGLDGPATDPATDASESGECGIGTYLDDGMCVIAAQPEDAPEPAGVDSEIEERLEKPKKRVGVLEGMLDSLKSIFGF